MVYNSAMLNRRRNLYIAIVISVAVILWLGPVIEATGNGSWTFLVSLQQKVGLDTSCYDPYGGSGAQACLDLQTRGQAIGVVICLLFGIVIVVCVFQLVRLWVRRHLH